MEFRTLEALLVELTGECERLRVILETERQAMKAWQVERIAELTFEKEAALANIQERDREFKDQLEHTSRHHSCSADQIFSHPGAARLRQLRAQVEVASRNIRQRGEHNRRIAEHLVAFLAQMQGAPPDQELPAYGPRGATYHSNLVHHIL